MANHSTQDNLVVRDVFSKRGQDSRTHNSLVSLFTKGS